MRRNTPFYIGSRYLLSRKGNRFISFTSLMSMAGITLGVFVLIVVLSVYNGSQGIQRERTLITVPHADLSAGSDFSQWQAVQAAISDMPGIEAVAPYLLTEAMISEKGRHQVAGVRGIDPLSEVTVSPVAGHMVLGSLDSLTPGSRSIILGSQVASILRVNVGDPVNLMLPVVNASSQGFELDVHRFQVTGIFDVRFSIGSNLAYVHLEDAAEIMGLDSVNRDLHLRLKTTEVNRAGQILDSVLAYLASTWPDAGFTGIDWSQSEASLFNALRMEKIMTGFMLMMIVAIGAFNIVATLVMVVSDKQADIAILRTMGTSERAVMGIFLVQGALVGLAGTIVGALAGVGLVMNFSVVADAFNALINPSGRYLIASLPAELQSNDVVFVCLASLIISFLATLYPAWRASGIQPAEVLRYE